MFPRIHLHFQLLFLSFVCFSQLHSQHFLTKRYRYGMSVSAGYTGYYGSSSLFVLRQHFTSNAGFDCRMEYQYTRKLALRIGLGAEYMTFSEDDNSSDGTEVAYYGLRPRSFDIGTCNYEQIQKGLSEYNENSFQFSTVSSRVYNVVYLTIPVEVLFRKEVSPFSRTYLKAGLHTGLRIYNKAQETGIKAPADTISSSYSYSDRIITRDLNVARVNLVAGAGYEHSFGGHSSVFIDMEAGFGIFNLFAQGTDKGTLYTASSIDQRVPATSITSDMLQSNSLRQFQLKLRIGFFF